jgi:hypothetical protein
MMIVMMIEETTEERVKKAFRKFTDDFSSADVEFVKGLSYPTKVRVTDFDLEKEEENSGTSVYLVENLDEILEVFKQSPTNCKIVIPAIAGKMTLVSREDK